jgi:hypothetical protein
MELLMLAVICATGSAELMVRSETLWHCGQQFSALIPYKCGAVFFTFLVNI